MVMLLRLILKLIDLYTLVLAVYALMSWFPQAQHSGLSRFVAKLSEPFLSYFRWLNIGMISFSVIGAVMFLQLVRYGVIVIFSNLW